MRPVFIICLHREEMSPQSLNAKSVYTYCYKLAYILRRSTRFPTNRNFLPDIYLQKAQTYHDVSYHVVSNLIIPPM